MLHALELENFKAFGKRSRILSSPITLMYFYSELFHV